MQRFKRIYFDCILKAKTSGNTDNPVCITRVLLDTSQKNKNKKDTHIFKRGKIGRLFKTKIILFSIK